MHCRGREVLHKDLIFISNPIKYMPFDFLQIIIKGGYFSL